MCIIKKKEKNEEEQRENICMKKTCMYLHGYLYGAIIPAPHYL